MSSLAVTDRADVFRKALDDARGAGLSVGLVPTMGALHRGHESLIRRSASECGLTAVTVFVNPLQFGPGEDLETYPRHLDADLVLADAAGAGVAFTPAEAEMYPDGAPATTVTVSGLSEGLEGASRPGHLTGVATVVATLFALAGPCRAYFGEKDFQQLAVVRRLVADLSFPVEVVGCPTVREPDGLACSSRNLRLSPEERAAAPVLHAALEDAAAAIRSGGRDADRLRRLMRDRVSSEPLARLDYAEVVDPVTLAPVASVAGDVRLVVAVWIGSSRLIDNRGVAA